MPELPEVNTVTTALARHLEGEKIIEWQRLSPKLRRPLPTAGEVEKLLQHPIKKIFRQAKSIFFDFGCTEFLHFHLGMTGYFCLREKPAKVEKHEHLRVLLKSGRCLSFFDSRKFGVVELCNCLPQRIPEPVKNDLSMKYLQGLCEKSSRPIKILLMDQSLIGGIGNIYASESLFKAGVLPDRPASGLKPAEVKKLYQAILKVISQSIESGLKSLLPDFKLDRDTGHFEIETLVYGQAGNLCCQCGKTLIENRQIGGRSSFFCPNCQK